MDVERTIEFLLDQPARFDAQQAQFRADFEERQKRYEERHEREIGAIRAELRRAVRLAIQEAPQERKRRQEEDARLAAADAKLTASHSELEKSIKQFLDSLNQPRNGHDQT